MIEKKFLLILKQLLFLKCNHVKEKFRVEVVVQRFLFSSFDRTLLWTYFDTYFELNCVFYIHNNRFSCVES